MSLRKAREALPVPLDRDEYTLLRRGVYDGPEEVWVNAAGDFAFLHPRPRTDYTAYVPRAKSLSLSGYKRTHAVIERRFEKIEAQFGREGRVLEIGAAEGAFLRHLARERPGWELSCVEVDRNTRVARDALAGLAQYATLGEVVESGARFDRICAFHVLEHFLEPGTLLAAVRACLADGGRLVLEVPSLHDPLLSLYHCAAYQDFYFQRQHPYVYAAPSLARLLEAHAFAVVEVIHHQRYGLENHLHWLTEGRPGGRAAFRDLFGASDTPYRADLERSGRTDAVIAVAEAR